MPLCTPGGGFATIHLFKPACIIVCDRCPLVRVVVKGSGFLALPGGMLRFRALGVLDFFLAFTKIMLIAFRYSSFHAPYRVFFYFAAPLPVFSGVGFRFAPLRCASA